jgi:DNA-binding NtrC family response regulator
MCALMTAFADVDSAITALAKGAFHYLQKPVRPIELFNR